jgi:translation initiation factor IF-1
MTQKNDRFDRIEFVGQVIDSISDTFKVKVDNSSSIVLCSLNGKLRMNKIKILTGDRVKIEVSPYDMSRGRVCYRFPTRSNENLED